MTPSIKQRVEQIRLGEFPKGYVKTRVGVLPIQWETRPLSSYLSESFVIGNTGNVAKKITVKLWNKGVVAKKEIHRGSENTRYYKRKKGQLIYSKLDFLNCAFGIIPESLDGFESTQDLPAFDIEGVDPVFLLSQIVQKRFYERWGTMVANGGRKARRISEDDFLSFPIAVPRIEEQRKIAAILTAQDKVIELKERLLAEKQRQKAYLMQQLLTGKKRLPGFSGAWKKVRLGDVCVVNPPRDDDCPEVVTFLGMADISETGSIIAEHMKNYESVKKGFTPFKKGDILIAKITPCFENGKGALTDQCSSSHGFGSTEFHVLRSKGMNGKLLYHHTRMISFRKRLESEMVGSSGQRRVQVDSIMRYAILLPSTMEQAAIVEVLSSADREIDLLQWDIKQEEQTKKALMQLLLTGIVRVNA